MNEQIGLLLQDVVERGHPFKGESREKTPLLNEKISLFRLAQALARTSTALFSPLLAPVTSFSFGSGHISDLHQSPIGIKAIVVFEALLHTLIPLSVDRTQKIIGSMPCPIGCVLQILWFLASPF
jgi:hypothetical protein